MIKWSLPFRKESAEFTSGTVAVFILFIIPIVCCGDPGVACCSSTSGWGDDVGDETLPLAFGVKHAYKPEVETFGFETTVLWAWGWGWLTKNSLNWGMHSKPALTADWALDSSLQVASWSDSINDDNYTLEKIQRVKKTKKKIITAQSGQVFHPNNNSHLNDNLKKANTDTILTDAHERFISWPQTLNWPLI